MRLVNASAFGLLEFAFYAYSEEVKTAASIEYGLQNFPELPLVASNCTKLQGQSRDALLKTNVNRWSKEAAAATRGSDGRRQKHSPLGLSSCLDACH